MNGQVYSLPPAYVACDLVQKRSRLRDLLGGRSRRAEALQQSLLRERCGAPKRRDICCVVYVQDGMSSVFGRILKELVDGARSTTTASQPASGDADGREGPCSEEQQPPFPLSPNKNQRLPPLFAARLLSHNEGKRSATLQQWP